MVIDTITSPSQPQEQHGEASRDSRKALTFKLTMLEKQFVEDRVVSIKDKIEKNGKYLQRQLSAIISTLSRSDPLLVDENTTNMLSSRIKHPLQKFSGFSQGLGEEDHIHNNDVLFTRSLKIPYVERLPPYTFWIHLARNHRMTEDDSVIGKRRIYYDHHGGEALICSDNEEELREHQEVKHDYSHDEDQIIWVAFEEHGSTKEVLDVVKDFVGGTKSEIQERYINLKEQNMRRLAQHSEDSGECGINLDQSLSAALDTFDQLFCRQCLILDCPLHGCSQPLIYPSEKQSVWSELDGDKKPCSDHCYLRGFKDGQKDVTNEIELKQLSNSMEGQVHEMLSRTSDWKPLEKDLYLKGVEMFGRNSCLIYRNLLSGLKTCMEVASYMNAGEGSIPQDINGNINANCTDHEMPSRSRSQRKRGKPRKFKYSSKSGLPSMWKRITTGKNQSERQYTPCGCQGMCGKECPCLLRGSCCEKYCGCSKLCRNRFRGCHCAKSQCKSRQCPCFAAQRECDPDVCRNCWVSCGDGSLGEPPRHGDGQCGNMKILLRQKQRILLARSDVAGWGAFLKNPANKNDYLGEYTGELVSQIEAEKRGKIYDRENFSFLFNLNDQYVLDAYRKGDKLKFANHSSKPNCFAKVMFVAGDHRVGIFAKERIEAGEELFYNYNYGPEHLAKLLDEESRRDKSLVSQGKGKKHQSH